MNKLEIPESYRSCISALNVGQVPDLDRYEYRTSAPYSAEVKDVLWLGRIESTKREHEVGMTVSHIRGVSLNADITLSRPAQEFSVGKEKFEITPCRPVGLINVRTDLASMAIGFYVQENNIRVPVDVPGFTDQHVRIACMGLLDAIEDKLVKRKISGAFRRVQCSV